MKELLRKFRKIIYVAICIIFSFNMTSYAKSNKTEEDRINVLYLAEIIDDKDNLDLPVKRQEFAKMIVKSSNMRNSVSPYITEAVCTDVGVDNIYASFIKLALSNGNMFTYLGGYFKPEENTSFSDLTRACLTLLGYKNSDFSGNRVTAFNDKFVSLELNENIDKNIEETITKRDIINAIYNTLKENKKDTTTCYGTSVFLKLTKDKDGELEAFDMLEKKIDGPNIVKVKDDITNNYNLDNYTIYINGVKENKDSLIDDIDNYGFAVYYVSKDKSIIYAYTERKDISAPMELIKGYVIETNYNANDFLIPYRVNIDDSFYLLDSEEMKYAFSPAGKYKAGDHIYFICNKYNDVSTAYRTEGEATTYDDDGNVEKSDGKRYTVNNSPLAIVNSTYTGDTSVTYYNNDDAVIYKGSLVTAFKID